MTPRRGLAFEITVHPYFLVPGGMYPVGQTVRWEGINPAWPLEFPLNARVADPSRDHSLSPPAGYTGRHSFRSSHPFFKEVKEESMSKSLALALALVAAGAHAAEFKAAYVDIQRALQETDEGRAAKGRLQALVEGKQKSLEAEKNALQKEVEAFQKQSPTMDDKVRAGKEQELQKKTYEFAQKGEKIRQELAENERRELGGIMPKLEQLIGQIAQREGLTMVFDKSSSGLAWAPSSLDLTNELIRMYNSQFKAAGPAKAAPAPAAPKAADAPKN